ncbi:hypothetical protein [Eubacterium aggregans]|uniref:hypothetical protein n=1 Tax=Eubacterium aggregans TaxID=81409 RepID=UPI003F2EFF2A
MRILLVEPAYKNKYPPMGLMKISTYHKRRGDYVQFYKGLLSKPTDWDRVYITTLFTFDYKMVLKTVKHYRLIGVDASKIFIGGIMASLMTERLIEDTGVDNIIKGRLVSSNQLEFDDDINIDELPIDYDILEDIEYQYPVSNSIIAYTSRGGINRCSFCAVPRLEGDLCITNNIKNQINYIRTNFGDKRDLMLLDNNILEVPISELEKIVRDFDELGYKNEKTFKYPSKIDYYLQKYNRFSAFNQSTQQILVESKGYIKATLKSKRISKNNRIRLNEIIEYLEEHPDYFEAFSERSAELKEICDTYLPQQFYQRYIDFNHGLDA